MKSLPLRNIRLVIFDFDGTIADTSEGILDSHKYTFMSTEHVAPSDEKLRSVIGGNLLKIYVEKFGFDTDSAKNAVKIYRERYKEVGIHMATLYPGIEALLSCLRQKGIKTAVATLKADAFVKQMIDELGINQYFDCVYGMNSDDTFEKAELITKCMSFLTCNHTETLFIGDSVNDYVGAKKAEVEFVGVTYGFGFVKGEPHEFITIDNPKIILNIISNE
ncbi:MAG: HAD hydrolase-like protein [Butyrivibrio sp.]|uniref:HAD family hydrolase n=1 Tax=Butyrivibrio sp. TaxID=28121 RepID=UPI0025F0284E|nr:HAD hydrolase-like protein [Butyrivibrio sp.]MCR5772845.1 HAD hydrolase-like protein [Butyrivibrio sp.]